MTRLAEIRHVLLKDVQEARRLVLLYVAVVLVATAHAADLGVFASETFGMSMMFVMLVGALLAASVVQADSPTRSDAFWATHPFRRSSMLGAKVAFALLVILVAAVGQVIGIHSYDLPPFVSRSLVVGPVLLFGMVLLGVALLASVTRDLRSFIIAAIVIPIVVLFATSVLERRPSSAVLRPQTSGIGDLHLPLQILGLVATGALLVWLYLTRDDRRRTRVLACGVVTLTLMATCSDTSPPDVREEAITSPPPLAIALEPIDPRSGPTPGELPLVVHVSGIGEGLGAQLELPLMHIHLTDGSVLDASLENSRIEVGGIWPGRFIPPRVAGVRWVVSGRSSDVRHQLNPELTATQRRALRTGVAGIVIDGRVTLWESHASNTMPLVVGGEATADGSRTRIVEWTPDDELSTLVVDESRIDTARATSPYWMPMLAWPQFALINEARGEAVPLHRTQSGGGIDGLVLPGVPLRSERGHLGLRQGARSDTTLPDLEWLRGARLMPVTTRPVGSYRVRLELKDWPGAAGASPVSGRASSPVALPVRSVPLARR